MYIRGLIHRKSAEMAEAVPIPDAISVSEEMELIGSWHNLKTRLLLRTNRKPR